MQKIIFVQNSLPLYRRAFYNYMAKKYQTIVIHSSGSSKDFQNKYQEIILSFRKVGTFFLQKRLISTIRKLRPDRIIVPFDFHCLSACALLLFRPKKTRLIWWGFAPGRSLFAMKLKVLITKLGHPIIFYEKNIMAQYLRSGGRSQNIYVGNNTVHVPGQLRAKSFQFKKEYLLFVSRLDKRKQLDVSIRAFKKACARLKKRYSFIIIGDGPEYHSLQQLIADENLTDQVLLRGKEYDFAKLQSYYQAAFAEVTFNASGLSILQAFAFGVPYITTKNAYSNGEKNHIIHGFNGLLCDNSQEAFSDALFEIMNNLQLAEELGRNAYNYYSEHCTIDKMAIGFENAIKAG